MKAKILGFLTAALLASPMAANAQDVYDYTGAITHDSSCSECSPIPIGSQVTGTFTFDYANGNPAQSSGAIGSAGWTVTSYGGGYSSKPSPLPTSLVFAMTAQVDGFSFASQIPSGPAMFYPSGGSSVQGYANSGGRGSTFIAYENWTDSPSYSGGSSINISNPRGAYSVTGLPILAGATLATGTAENFVGADSSREIDFNITSLNLTSAPEIDPASAAGGLTLLLSGLAIAMGARRSRSPERSVT
jgi:hypothetical protein